MTLLHADEARHANLNVRVTPMNIHLIACVFPESTMESVDRNFHPKEALEALLDRASNYISNKRYSYKPLKWFYRDKDRDYYDDVLRSGCMEKYLKDNNGDPLSPINGRLEGLHFSVNVDRKSGKPCKPSVFGPKRLKTPAPYMFEKCPNLYFSDFYCLKNGVHHVTLVMTRQGSSSDSFCSRFLPNLDIDNNLFIQRTSYSLVRGHQRRFEPEFSVLCSKVWIEVLFTEDIDINEAFDRGSSVTSVWWRGNKRTGPRLKDPSCMHCNLPSWNYPQVNFRRREFTAYSGNANQLHTLFTNLLRLLENPS